MTKPIPMTAAERNAANTARVLRCNRSSHFAVAFSRNTPGINTEPVQDRDKTQ
jgi:hypothetical protein